MSLDLLEHGIHLLIEKPLATTVAEADEVLAAARRNGAMVQVGHIERFNPAWNQAEVTPLLRCPKYIDATRTSGYTFRSTDIGVVLDMMIHDLDLVLHFANSPVRNVQALGISVLGDHEDVAQARLEFANGCVANLSASRVSYQPVRQMQVWSEHGCVTVDFSTHTATAVRPVTELLQREFDLDDVGPESRAHLKDHLFEDLLPMERHVATQRNALWQSGWNLPTAGVAEKLSMPSRASIAGMANGSRVGRMVANVDFSPAPRPRFGRSRHCCSASSTWTT